MKWLFVLVRVEVMIKFFLEEKKKDCLKMMPAPLFPSGLLSRSPRRLLRVRGLARSEGIWEGTVRR